MGLIRHFKHITKLKLKIKLKQITDSNQLLLSNSVYNPFCATNSQLERQLLNKYWVLAPHHHHHRLLTFVRGKMTHGFEDCCDIIHSVMK
jgi:hypothetical protein